MPPTVTSLFIGSIILFLTASKVWAIELYSQKFGIECKGCHTSIPNLNERGVTFKKNGHTVAWKNEQPSTKPNESSIKNKDELHSVTQAPVLEQYLSQKKIYIWKSEKGTPHFSDVPVEIVKDNKAATTAARRKIVKRVGTRSSSLNISENAQNGVVTPATPKPSYEKCMENTLISYPVPTNAEIAMEQFLYAENLCLPSGKAQ